MGIWHAVSRYCAVVNPPFWFMPAGEGVLGRGDWSSCILASYFELACRRLGVYAWEVQAESWLGSATLRIMV